MAFLGLLLLAVAILGIMIARNFQHFDTALSYVNYSHRIQNVSLRLQQSVIAYLADKNPDSQALALSNILTEMDELIADHLYLSTVTKANLVTARTMLTNLDKLASAERSGHFIKALDIMDQTLDLETLQRETLLEEINGDTQRELYTALLIFAIALLGAILFLHYRILHPLNDLRLLLERLADSAPTPISISHLDPLLTPVFNSYNEMVARLNELEAVKREYAQSLQREVRLATQTLLEQQSSLARAERLAAVGEVAAELAHEIRNPLAGIQMAFSNLRKEIADPAYCERMDLIAAELKRVADLLSDMLKQSKHTPEAAETVVIASLIKDLLKLARYQIAGSITLVADVPESLSCHVSASELRQALLNLLLNAADSIGNQPGQICINAHSEAQGVVISVTDSGPGFPDDMLEYGIRPFRTSRTRGTGLGLAMVQRFVKNAGGNLKLSNPAPQGACVTLFLPTWQAR
jgi:signal transduction histidine kinase